eukprot:TRINITY_DN6286_c0_g1_i4.p1 TRINITY_DN6286_c0_g1~~TRINITY_DN6286_c0_g1_i4.p1  ORF type:complete len:158 (+),score=29.21 TRINITY_DN6286_c0_g1_i4:133-606(+)
MTQKDEIKSRFLEELYENKGKKQVGYDPRDVEGPRLGEWWQPGDNAFTVTFKRVLSFWTTLLDPDTYSREKWKQLKRYYFLNDVYILMAIAGMATPFIFYLPWFRPRVQKLRREYFMHLFEKRKFFSDHLNLRYTKMRLNELKDIMRKFNENDNRRK